MTKHAAELFENIDIDVGSRLIILTMFSSLFPHDKNKNNEGEQITLKATFLK